MQTTQQNNSTISKARTARLLSTDYNLRDCTIEATLSNGTIRATVPQTKGDVARQIFRAILAIIPPVDDPGIDWLTDEQGNTYLGDRNWIVSDDPRVACLVDAANIITIGRVLRVEDQAVTL